MFLKFFVEGFSTKQIVEKMQLTGIYHLACIKKDILKKFNTSKMIVVIRIAYLLNILK